jgi:serine/threonine protein kinase
MNESEANQNMSKKCPQCGKPLPTGALDGLCPACLLAQGVADTGPEAAPFQPPGVEEVARLFPQLEILAFIGKGGMGAVYKARQPALDRFVALKILPPQVASGPGFAERFSREARALARLSHPNIVAVHEFGQVNGLPFFIMEFVDGLNLRQLERAGKLSPREALQIVPQICEALQFAHDEGIVHRDIKPENILLDKKGRVKIADFGIAKIMGREPDVDLTQTKDAIGTPHYMAPEQVEKPQTVDHRADIFSLGVVFYEMLTGELPLGKFAPPSSRKVEVDVRLDYVVLHALEKDPERRYQHVSQVKTAVDTIASTAASPPLTADAGALAQEILARDYSLDIGSCLRRGWALVRSDFWPLVAVTALIIALLAVANSFGAVISSESGKTAGGGSVLGLLVYGPLVGGLSLYFLKKIRGEQTSVETAFSGFSNRFLHLFLGSFVGFVLTGLGFVCLILPGIYLLVSWIFTLTLVIDKRLDFWSAMELSRKTVSKHWWKFFGFALILLLLKLAGLLVFCIGFFLAVSIATATLMYAYEDIFNATGRTANPPLAGVGPSGTAVLPGTPPKLPRSGGGIWKPVVIGLVAVVVLVIGLIAMVSIFHGANGRQQRARQNRATAALPAQPTPPAGRITNLVFGPVIEQVFTNEGAIDFDSGRLVGQLPESVRRDGIAESVLAAFAWMEKDGLDALYITSEGLLGAGMKFRELDELDWTNMPPSKLGRMMASLIPDPLQQVRMRTATNGPATYGFKTREGGLGVLQVFDLADNPGAVKIRYKLVKTVSGAPDSARDTSPATYVATVSAEERNRIGEDLAARLAAAEKIMRSSDQDKALAALARDAAKAGEAGIVKTSLGRIMNQKTRDEVAYDSARSLAKRGLRKQAIEVAERIMNSAVHDEALSELAQ